MVSRNKTTGVALNVINLTLDSDVILNTRYYAACIPAELVYKHRKHIM